MSTIAAHVKTANGGKYVKQLSSHWGHKFPVELEGETGAITFPNALVILAGDPDGIAITITGEDREGVERLTGVVASHIDRFAFREVPLDYQWHWQETATQD
ncbi:hypothetical protein WSK_1275 [Novosphingobium sp. Rr 2-17]|uniref:DUF2218 domain-containing protein n=1 Tax=Novosphingobium sp. Rr 2-17 TaxID=555793 RepID=UPI0002697E75|nr:DUF2218 domain-containing protein [Novosphingobium sp. Rr 2-17]EIZ80241.1 hypothetical protein WSK_1275 [Novosphingobium sp. Rr 2-17]